MINSTDCLNNRQLNNTSNSSLIWSFGSDKFDVRPVNYEGTTQDLISFIDENRAPVKGKNYITSAMLPESQRLRGRRCKDNALPRSWLALDMDGDLSDADFMSLVAWFKTHKCIIYETASSKKNARRFRVILILSRPVVELEAKIIGELVQKATNFEGWDASTHRAAQPIYLPPIEVPLITFDAQPLDVGYWLLKAPPPKPPPKPRRMLPMTTENIFGWFANHNMVLEVGSSMHKVICPWGDQHTDGRLEAGLFEPSSENNLSWGFKCLHAHCDSKSIKDIYRLMKGQK